MIKDGRPRLIDFQGARPGPPAYDLAGMILDPYTTLDEDMKAGLLDYYISRRRGGGRFDEKSFVKTYPLLSACRLLQALGAYGNLSRNQGKTYFEAFIPGALDGLDRVLAQPALDFMPGLRALVRDIIEELENRI
jgi:aminoglycoside/choline kinase family phosphotransferase